MNEEDKTKGQLIDQLSKLRQHLTELDISKTERKKAEEKLRAREERYRSYIEVTGQLAWTTNTDGEVVEDIPAWRKFTGQSEEETKGWGWSEVIHPDDLNHTKQVWTKAVKTKSVYKVEYRLRRYDGVYQHFLALGIPVLKEDGNIREWVGTCIDITERKQAGEALQRSEETARQLGEENAIMAEIGRIISSTLNIEEVYERFTEEVHKMIPFDRISINIINHEKETVTIAYSVGIKVTNRQLGDVFPLAGSFIEKVMRDRSGFLIQIEDMDEFKTLYFGFLITFMAGLQSMIAVPLISKDEVIGVFLYGII